MSTATTIQPSSLAWLRILTKSTVGSKYLVGITGLLLTGFVLAHMAGNLQVFIGREALNKYALAIKEMGPLLWLARGGLLAIFLMHILLALRLKKKSMDARPIRYRNEDTVQATWASRHMVLTGLVILAFVLFHLAHFTFGIVHEADIVVDGQTVGTENFLKLKEKYVENGVPKERHDVYAMVIHGFRSLPVSVLYIIAQVLLGVHLFHGLYSVFQTFGLNHHHWNVLIRWFAYLTTAAIVGGNVAMPVAIYFRLI